jgi:hypothetical protein
MVVYQILALFIPVLNGFGFHGMVDLGRISEYYFLWNGKVYLKNAV